MKTHRAYKTELDPNNAQRTALLRHAGAARWAYNWGLNRKIEAYENGEKSPTAIDLHRELNSLKRIEFSWLYEVSKCAPQEALRNLDRAFDNFFRRCKTGKGKPGFPRFKSRKRGIGSFTLTGSIRPEQSRIRLPRIGWLRLKEPDYLPMPTSGVKILHATVSEQAGRWFVSVQVEEERPDQKPTIGEPVGIDVGIKHLAVLSNGMVFENPKALHAAKRRLRMLEKQKSRRQKGGANRRKTVAQIARQHYRIACIRKDAIHKATSAVIAKQPSAIGIESLNVAEMLKNHCLAGAVADAGMGEFHRQIRYKAEWAGIPVVEADRWYPSSKTCSYCGHVLESLPLGVWMWTCPECQSTHDRDVNAAINLRNMAVSSTVTACCPGSSGPSFAGELLVGQEPNTRWEDVLNG